MKIIQTADIHLGSKMDSKYSKKISDTRKRELRDTFKRLVEYALQNEVSVIMLCGDIFDSDRPFKKDKDFFYSVIRENPKIDFLYLKGNHDICDKLPDDIPQNLKTFSDEWTYYVYDNVVIAGIEILEKNASSYPSALSLEDNKLNIVMLHGQINGTGGCNINLKKLRNKKIDYLALGHIHKYTEGVIDDRGKYVYSGCLEGRGFDETGDHGFVLLDIDEDKINDSFIPFACRKIIEIDVDVSGCNAYNAYNKVINSVDSDNHNIYRINLTGEKDFDIDELEKDVEQHLSDYFYFVSVKDKMKKKIDITKYENDLSIRGEFIRTVYAEKNISEQDKLAIINYGLRALEGKEIET